MSQKDYEGLGWAIILGSVFTIIGLALILGLGGFFLGSGLLLLIGVYMYVKNNM